MSASSHNLHVETKDMQINATRVKSFTLGKKKRCIEEGLYLYCGKGGHEARNCSDYNTTVSSREVFTLGKY